MAPQRTSLSEFSHLRPVASPLALDEGSLSHFLDQCHRRRHPARSDIFRPGDTANTLYYVVSGSLSIISVEGDGRELVLGYINALSLLFFSIVFLAPRIVGDSVGIYPAILTVVLIAMGEALGFLGIVLSASIAAVARDLFSYTYQRFGGATPVTARANVRVFAKAPIE